MHISRSIVLWRGRAVRAPAQSRNYGREPASFDLALAFDADFADIFEVRGIERARRGDMAAGPDRRRDRVLAYRGLDDVVRRTRLSPSIRRRDRAGGTPR